MVEKILELRGFNANCNAKCYHISLMISQMHNSFNQQNHIQMKYRKENYKIGN